MPDDPLFITYCRKPIAAATLCDILKLLAKDVVCKNSPSLRIHDIRHTFAVHRLLRWYREGADVQSKLPLLSAFMGHTEIRSTEVYLTITMDLLKEANDRFYNHCGKELQI
jgi:integrase